MDENKNQNYQFDENEKETTEGGNISGFDTVGDNNDDVQGYTVTPQGGYYTRKGEDIIQDDIEPDKTESGFNADTSARTDFRPNGSYGAPQSQYSQSGYNPQDPANWYGGQRPQPPKAPKPKKQKKQGGYSVAVVLAASLLAAVIGAVSAIGVMNLKKDDAPIITNKGEATNISINVDEKAESIAQAVAAKASPSVVGIRTTTSVMSFFGGSSQSQGEGSGVIYTQDGYIITNYHVISSAVEGSSDSKIEVFLESSETQSYPATVIGYNISSDLAVIKIDASGLPAAQIGNSDELKVGQYVVTIGSPGGLEFMGSVTYGIVSGLDRGVSSALNVPLIQTDAAINPGNSGGALLDSQGRLVGINSSKIVSEEFEGMGFAIPINTVVEKCDRIIARQNEPEPYIGIAISEKYTANVLKYYGFPTGAVVLSVDNDSPAYSAGVRKGDIITEFNGTALTSYTMYNDLLLDCEPDSKISVKIYRSGRYYSAEIQVLSNNQN